MTYIKTLVDSSNIIKYETDNKNLCNIMILLRGIQF